MFNTAHRGLAAATVLASLSLAMPSQAANVAPDREKTAQDNQSANDTAPSMSTRYCVVARPDTGSRIARKTCKTRAQWLEQDDIDPAALKRK